MSDSKSKKIGLSCPVCECVYAPDKLSTHVAQHFENEVLDSANFKKCSFPDCHVFIKENELDDHMIAHSLHAEENLNVNDAGSNTQLDDSILANILQQEEECIAGPSSVETDSLLAQKAQIEELQKGETISYENLKETYGMSDKKIGYVKQFEKAMDKKVGREVGIGDYFARKSAMMNSMMSGKDSGETRTPEIIKLLVSSCNNAIGRTSYFSTETDHFSVGIADKGWGCGFRNIQMLLSSMLKNEVYHKALSIHGIDAIPSIPRLQLLIEQAWKDGYDIAGCEQLGGCLQDTKKWIGTTEAAALFAWLKIRTKIIDFHRPSTGNTHPEMFKWIHNYFRYKTTLEGEKLSFPLYLQHQGHSRLCIGCEMKSGEDYPITLLMLDPSHSKAKMKLFSTQGVNENHMKTLKKSINQMKQNQFQVLYLDGLYITELEIEASKIIRSSRIPP